MILGLNTDGFGFYDKEIHGNNIPTPNFNIEDEAYNFFLKNNGKYKLKDSLPTDETSINMTNFNNFFELIPEDTTSQPDPGSGSDPDSGSNQSLLIELKIAEVRIAELQQQLQLTNQNILDIINNL